MRVSFALRGDALTKPGGDSNKVIRYVDHLKEMGIEARVATSVKDLASQRPDVVHSFNVDLPLENSRYLDWAGARGLPFVLSPILHPIAGTEAFFKSGDDWFNRGARTVGLTLDGAYGIRDGLRVARGKDFGALRNAVTSRRSLRKRLVLDASVILPMCPGEAVELRQLADTKSLELRVVRNALSFSPVSPRAGVGRRGVAVLGRVEPRKNQVGLLQAWREYCPTEHLTFAGSLNHSHPRYIKRFHSLVESLPNVRWLGNLDRDGVRAVLTSNDVHFGCSWYEVISQADLEAVTLGMAVVTTIHSYARDYFDGPLTTSDPARFDHTLPELLDMARQARAEVRLAPQMNRSWRDVAAELAEIYREL